MSIEQPCAPFTAAGPESEPYPHEAYIRAVGAGIEAAGILTTLTWAQEADEQTLIGLIEFDPEYVSRCAWPRGVFGSWDQERGWALLVPGDTRASEELALGPYASPAAVADTLARRLAGEEPGEVLEWWDGAEPTAAAVAAWLAAGTAA